MLPLPNKERGPGDFATQKPPAYTSPLRARRTHALISGGREPGECPRSLHLLRGSLKTAPSEEAVVSSYLEQGLEHPVLENGMKEVLTWLIRLYEAFQVFERIEDSLDGSWREKGKKVELCERFTLKMKLAYFGAELGLVDSPNNLIFDA